MTYRDICYPVFRVRGPHVGAHNAVGVAEDTPPFTKSRRNLAARYASRGSISAEFIGFTYLSTFLQLAANTPG